jgi:type I restriction enzyme R subunit
LGEDQTLKQTIARANQVFNGKSAGQVVDYINIFSSLQEALGLYVVGIAEGKYLVDSDAKDKSNDDDLWPKTCSDVYMHIF